MVGPELAREAEILVMQAVAGHRKLGAMLVLKGAHAVEALTGTVRSTRDIDLTARTRFAEPGKEGAKYLKQLFFEAVESHLRNGLRLWSIYAASAKPKPQAHRHKFGWDGFEVKLTLQHRKKAQHVIEIDVSFGDYTEGTVSILWKGRSPILNTDPTPGALACYSTEQALAEKLRAWLQKLPAYLQKVGGGQAAPRVRDLRDIHFLLDSAGDALDWDLLGSCFVEKCLARSVDFSVITDAFPDAVDVALLRSLYDDDNDISDVTFDVACSAVIRVLEGLVARGMVPGVVPIPKGYSD